jgi:flavin-dependent dehydrogenase
MTGSKIPESCDVTVIGGGPTGSTAANKLASRGYHVVLLDKAVHPRNTVGESLVPHFWRYADDVGATQDIIDEGFTPKGGGLSFWGNELRRLRFRDFGHERQPLHVERDIFDHILLRKAGAVGAQIFQGVQVTTIENLEGPVIAVNYRDAEGEPGTLRTRYMVDASGQAAVVASQLKIRAFDEGLRFSAFWGYYRKSKYLTFDGALHDDEDKYEHPPATLMSTIGDWGWSWHIVLRNSVSVGVLIPKARLSELRGKTPKEREERFKRHVANIPLTGRLLDEDDFIPGSLLSIRDYAYKPITFTAGNCYLAGDAAAFVDPINSIGVVFGMFSGSFSAHAISRSLEKPHEAQLNRDLYSTQYGNRVALFRMLALPNGHDHLSREDIDRAKAAISSSSDAELQLMALQATNNLREGVLHEMFDGLGISKRPKIEQVDWQALPL